MSVEGAATETPLLHALVVDDEAPAREELAFLLRDDPRIAEARPVGSAGEALRILADHPVDVIFCDIKMPGLDGVELARVVSRFAERPHIVFVTAYDDRAVDAFEVQAVDYLLKPVRADRLAEAVRRVVSAATGEQAADDDETIAVELAGVTRFVRRSQVRFVEAHGDYARLHTAAESHLLRTTLAELEERWAGAGFVRIHRSTLVALAHVAEVHVAEGRYSVRVGNIELPVSRRHTRELRERLVHR
jgi:DNA-binding LytR/AlgR family response regulator